ncbi:hypothetical protein N788_03655 [Arenimonas donghaensis DSM 18148 = HO3-R19]|uniref:Uncharacterized protein n=1 Tax=Arenimonas donghaensis DSM 18148 = HO3-R19 TaxID=1121014 RepID=A0A087MIL3_9GAMM|nr:hypothetical protein N788_03655 [Arenimonas donghaensis DSM 18148 = HO3-R19]
MGRLLDGLQAESEEAAAANPANVGSSSSASSQIREIREVQEVENQLRRQRLLALAASEGLAAALVYGQPEAELSLCDQLPEGGVRAYLRALDASNRIGSGLVPSGWSHRLDCAHCGPVWWHRGGSVLACPWCARHRAGKAFPRPIVTCRPCRHAKPDHINPYGGVGRCALEGARIHWPDQRHVCAEHKVGEMSDA